MTLYRLADYARIKGVSRPYVSQLSKEGKLITIKHLGNTCVVDCQENDALFLRPSHLRRKPIKAESAG